jgi:hypothetical protein
MVVPDTSDRRLRGEISAAVRNHRPELEAELRRELALRNIERAVTRYLDGAPLSATPERDRDPAATGSPEEGVDVKATQRSGVNSTQGGVS